MKKRQKKKKVIGDNNLQELKTIIYIKTKPCP